MLRSRIQILAASILFVLTLATTACDKAMEPEDNTISLLVASPWKFSRVTASGLDVSSLVEACYKDNLLTLNAPPASTGVLDEGATKCSPTAPQTINFTWAYDADLRKLSFSAPVALLPGASPEGTLVRVTNTELVLSQTVDFNGTSQLVEVTLVH